MFSECRGDRVGAGTQRSRTHWVSDLFRAAQQLANTNSSNLDTLPSGTLETASGPATVAAMTSSDGTLSAMGVTLAHPETDYHMPGF